MSKIKVNEIEKASGSGITVPTGSTFTITDGLEVSSLPTVTVAKGGTNLTSFTAGDLLYATGSTTLAKLAKGTASQTLKMNSGASAPEWATVTTPTGTETLLQTQTVSSSVASVTFVHGTGGVVIDGTYDFYKLLIHDYHSSAAEVQRVQVLVGGSPQSGGHYGYSCQNRNNSNTVSTSTDSGTDTSWRLQARNMTNTSTRNAFSITYFSTKAPRWTSCMSSSGGWNGNDEISNEQMGGIWKQTSAINGFKIFLGSGTIDKGKFSLYGITG